MSDEKASAGGTPVVPPATAATTPAPAAEPFAVFPDAESFQKRVERETKKRLKDLGIDDVEQAKARLDAAAAAEKAAEEAKRAQMTEIERLRADQAKAQADAKEAMTRAEEAEMRAHLHRVFAEEGIRNFDYGFFAVTRKLATIPEDETLDERAYLRELAKDPTQAAALGIAPPPAQAAPSAQRPATSTPVAGSAPLPPGAGAPAPAKTAFDMSPAEWAAYKARNGIG